MTAIVLIKQGFNYYGLIIGNIAASLYLLLFFYILNRKTLYVLCSIKTSQKSF